MPYAKTGGLADVAGALCAELAGRGHDVRAFMPSTGWRAAPGISNRLQQCKAQSSRWVPTTRFRCKRRSFREPHSPSISSIVRKCSSGRALYQRSRRISPFFAVYAGRAQSLCVWTLSPMCFIATIGMPRFCPCCCARPMRLSLAQVPSVLTIHNIGYQGGMPADAAPEGSIWARAELLDKRSAPGVHQSLEDRNQVRGCGDHG